MGRIKFILKEEPENFSFYNDHEIELTYENYEMKEALRVFLIDLVQKGITTEKDVPKGFQVVGDIACLGLTDKLMPYKNIIGQIILDKHPKVRTVALRTEAPDDNTGFKKLICIAGEKDRYETLHLEDQFKFKFDMSKVYFAANMAHERNRLIR